MYRLKQLGVMVLAVVLMMGGTVAVAGAQSAQDTGAQASRLVTGKITELDFAQGTLTLDNGEQFTLPENLEYTSLPMLGQAVEVTFDEQNGQKVVQQIDPNDTGKSN
jgi:hypothetical protein